MAISCIALMAGGSVVENLLSCVCADKTHVQVVRDGSRSQAPQYAVGAAATGHSAPCRHWCCRGRWQVEERSRGVNNKQWKEREEWFAQIIYLLILKCVYYLTSPKVHLMYMRNTIIHVNVTGLNVFIRINEQCVCVSGLSSEQISTQGLHTKLKSGYFYPVTFTLRWS